MKRGRTAVYFVVGQYNSGPVREETHEHGCQRQAPSRGLQGCRPAPTVKVCPSPCPLHCSRAVLTSHNLLLLHSNRPCYVQHLCPQPHPLTARVISQSWSLPVSPHTPLPPSLLESHHPGDEAKLLSRGVSPSSCSRCLPHTLCLGLSTLGSGDSASSTIV